MTANMLRALANEASALDPSGDFLRFDIRNGYQGSMKEHDRCAYLTLGGVDVACARRWPDQQGTTVLIRDIDGNWAPAA
jgi:hypothetical protein